MNSSFAIWCKKENKDTKISLDVHFNLWKLAHKKKKDKIDYFLDIGLMVDPINEANQIKLFFPFSIQISNIKDLGSSLKQNVNLVNGIFNEDYIIQSELKSKQVLVLSKQNKSTEFIIYELHKESNDFTLESKFGGSLMTINLNGKNITDSPKCYFRFRICSDNLKSLIRKHKLSNPFFESAFTSTEVFDFRLNEKRNYHESLSECINMDGEFDIKKIHFLLLTNSNDDFISSGISATSRHLEKQIWQHYVEEYYKLDDTVAYHWKQKAMDKDTSIGSYNSLIKLKVFKSNFKTISLYLFIFALLTIFLNIMSNLLYDKLFNN